MDGTSACIHSPSLPPFKYLSSAFLFNATDTTAGASASLDAVAWVSHCHSVRVRVRVRVCVRHCHSVDRRAIHGGLSMGIYHLRSRDERVDRYRFGRDLATVFAEVG